MLARTVSAWLSCFKLFSNNIFTNKNGVFLHTVSILISHDFFCVCSFGLNRKQNRKIHSMVMSFSRRLSYGSRNVVSCMKTGIFCVGNFCRKHVNQQHIFNLNRRRIQNESSRILQWIIIMKKSEKQWLSATFGEKWRLLATFGEKRRLSAKSGDFRRKAATCATVIFRLWIVARS